MSEVAGYIERKSMLYKTGVEYGDYTMNHIQGCAHGCKYPCYAFLMAKRFGKVKTYEEWLKPYLVSNTLELLDKEIPKLKNKINNVQLCFTTDPFMFDYPEIEQLSLSAIKKLNAAGIPCTVLTKGILPEKLSELSNNNVYGVTLVSLAEEYRVRFEPNSSAYEARIVALKKLHDKGFKTWASMEPYPTPNIIEQDLNAILTKISFVDKIIFGRTNYSKEITNYKTYKDFYNKQARLVIDFCNRKNKEYHIKKGTITNGADL